jgi:hypothetical protein
MGSLKSAEQSRAIWPPEPGFFALRLVRRGWEVPARIVFDGEKWQAEIDGVASLPDIAPALAENVARIWQGSRRIAEHEFRWLEKLREWAKANQPEHPCLHPRQPIKPGMLKPILPRTL